MRERWRSGKDAAKLASSEHASWSGSHSGRVNGSKRFSSWSSERIAQVGLAGADADQRDAQLVAQEPDQVQEFAAHVAAAGQDVVQLVDDQDPDLDRAQQRQRHLLQLGQPLRGRSGAPSAASRAT